MSIPEMLPFLQEFSRIQTLYNDAIRLLDKGEIKAARELLQSLL